MRIEDVAGDWMGRKSDCGTKTVSQHQSSSKADVQDNFPGKP
jgi:hypothetical protein